MEQHLRNYDINENLQEENRETIMVGNWEKGN